MGVKLIPKTKIIATLGPASSKKEILRKMFISGLDVVRLNFSHGSLSEHIQRINLVRSLNKKMRRAIKIMQDLEGFRLRVGQFKNGFLELKKNQIVYFVSEEVLGENNIVHFDYTGSFDVFKKGMVVYIDDGKISLKIVDVLKKQLKLKVVVPGILKDRKGINIPEAKLSFPSITSKDRKDVEVFKEYKLDFLALSFVRNSKDIEAFKKLLYPIDWEGKIFAKVENKEAIRNIDEIIEYADGIIIARGDMGICLPIYKVPIIQKEIIKKCKIRNKPVVVATQMLESMIENSLPTRAEVSDVANAIFDGADYLLLSGETTVGKHPHKVVEMMNMIIKHTEYYLKGNFSKDLCSNICF